MDLYNREFYAGRHKNTVYTAATVLDVVGGMLPRIGSAVDLGCGVGTWLSVLRDRGTGDIVGIDGAWVNRDLLEIDEECFIEHEFNAGAEPPVERTFDLAISLEVAEHLPAAAAPGFVSLLTRLADFVLFSAAIPGQGGVRHVNEQWPQYWMRLFGDRGFQCLDVIRKSIWDDERIPLWYRQNVFLYVSRKRLSDLTISGSPSDHLPPELYMLSFKRATAAPGIKQSARFLLSAIRRKLGKKNGTRR